ncbi:unnamed protein product [Polarella glacialis]|uniref:Uncharacterized protein n=1 Tax=Polarella glacialis TaxID=89957 RepID=A0A813J9E4_POLGL|nr:unnamed protein product [Polarella glacialis]CAE8673679.1 unnamed protein product [Polarella glacialis]
MSKMQSSLFQVPDGGKSSLTSEALEISSDSTGFEEEVTPRKGHFMAWMSEASEYSSGSSWFEADVTFMMSPSFSTWDASDISSCETGFAEEFASRKGPVQLGGDGCTYTACQISEASQSTRLRRFPLRSSSQIASADSGFAEELSARDRHATRSLIVSL